MVISFCGKMNKRTPYSIYHDIENIVKYNLCENSLVKFLICDFSLLDYSVYGVLVGMQRKYPKQIEIMLLTADKNYIFNAEEIKKYYDSYTFFPVEHFKKDISNEDKKTIIYKFMIENSDLTIFSANEETVSEYAALKYAEEINKKSLTL